MSEWKTGLPNPGRKVLAFYRNAHGKCRTVVAEYIGEKSTECDIDCDDYDIGVYDDETDTYYWPAGWYERVENWDELSHIKITEHEITHWMPLPAAPTGPEAQP